ncbi:branched-chain amino acid ABC transporter permease [Rhodospirillaceae bacterium KN72]|uniref:Branched-chain amino acid ABC transporter permease n=1 Tax=Pacificispira spongiicola TaxID=2729598 RepID=A0A7Y0HFJ3_9PROT|nr:branched-chain amino acid ABC transporter permease [Pacificispira spongiicola]NMM43942.1 branched-chain amino acid ABC transporter permease [Pacificispira spongiicola]
MTTIFDMPIAILGLQILIGLQNGAFYALLSLGLAVIFGMMNVINFAHGAQYMLGAFLAYILLSWLGLGYWWALLLVPLLVGIFGLAVERLFLRHLYHLDHLYGLLLTFGLVLIVEGVMVDMFGASGLPYSKPDLLQGAERIPLSWVTGNERDIMMMPVYRLWVIAASIVVCLIVWFAIEKTRLGSYLRAATENPTLVRAFGINVPIMVMLTYGFGVALAGFAGVLAAGLQAVTPHMGSSLIIVVFAVVVIGGMGSIMGSILTGFVLGLIEAVVKIAYPEATNIVIFVIMICVLLVRPAGLFGREA